MDPLEIVFFYMWQADFMYYETLYISDGPI